MKDFLAKREHTFEVDGEIVDIEELNFLLTAAFVVQIKIETIREGEHGESAIGHHFERDLSWPTSRFSGWW